MLATVAVRAGSFSANVASIIDEFACPVWQFYFPSGARSRCVKLLQSRLNAFSLAHRQHFGWLGYWVVRVDGRQRLGFSDHPKCAVARVVPRSSCAGILDFQGKSG